MSLFLAVLTKRNLGGFGLLTLMLVVAGCGPGGARRGRLPSPPVVLPPEPGGVFVARLYRSTQGQTMPYRLFKPRDYDPSHSYPLVIFLHGASARGSDNRRQLEGGGSWGTDLWTREQIQRDYPSFVLAPQANPRDGSGWVRRWRPSDDAGPANQEPLDLVVALVAELQQEFAIDPDRLYVTGLSMGGFGTWSAISRYPRTFAAAVPICGGGDPAMLADKRTAVWAFHGSDDRVVPAQRSREMIDALRLAGAEPRYTEYPGTGHNSWEKAYQEPELVPWLFSQRRR